MANAVLNAIETPKHQSKVNRQRSGIFIILPSLRLTLSPSTRNVTCYFSVFRTLDSYLENGGNFSSSRKMYV